MDPIGKILGRGINADKVSKQNQKIDWRNDKQVNQLKQEIKEKHNLSNKQTEMVLNELSVARNITKDRALEVTKDIVGIIKK